MKKNIHIALIITLLFTSACIQKSNKQPNEFANISDFVGNNIITGDSTFFGGGIFEYPVNIAIEDLDFIAKIKVVDLGEFGLCRANIQGFGSAIVVKESSIEIKQVDEKTGTMIYSFALPFKILNGETYIIRFYKENKDIIFSILSSKLDFFNQRVTYDITHNFGRNWGNPSIFCINGSIEVLDVLLKKDLDENLNILAFGDSFVEGWSIINSLEKRYISLLKRTIKGNIEISARGGETTSSLSDRFDIELSKSKSNYVLLAIGTNDFSFPLYKSNMDIFIKKIKSAGKIPILVTVTPRLNYPVEMINSYVRNKGELYIDINMAVNNGIETSWNTTYVNSDMVHPNIIGNELIFKQTLFDLYNFFDTKYIYDISLSFP